MALTYTLTQIENWRELVENQPGTIECMCFASLFIGIDKIDADGKHGWRVFFERLRAWERATGPLSSDGEFIPPEVVERFVGLRTNATPYTPHSFKKQLAEAVIRHANDDLAAYDRKRAAPPDWPEISGHAPEAQQ